MIYTKLVGAYFSIKVVIIVIFLVQRIGPLSPLVKGSSSYPLGRTPAISSNNTRGLNSDKIMSVSHYFKVCVWFSDYCTLEGNVAVYKG